MHSKGDTGSPTYHCLLLRERDDAHGGGGLPNVDEDDVPGVLVLLRQLADARDAVHEGGRGRLAQQAQRVQPGDLGRADERVALAVGVVGRDRDDTVVDRGLQGRLGDLLHVRHVHARQLRHGERLFLVVVVDLCAARAPATTKKTTTGLNVGPGRGPGSGKGSATGPATGGFVWTYRGAAVAVVGRVDVVEQVRALVRLHILLVEAAAQHAPDVGDGVAQVHHLLQRGQRGQKRGLGANEAFVGLGLLGGGQGWTPYLCLGRLTKQPLVPREPDHGPAAPRRTPAAPPPHPAVARRKVNTGGAPGHAVRRAPTYGVKRFDTSLVTMSMPRLRATAITDL